MVLPSSYRKHRQRGTYFQIGQGSGGDAVSLAVRQNFYIKYEVTLDPSRKTLEDHHLIKGIVSAKEEENQTNGTGTKQNTTFKNTYLPLILGGSKSIAADTLITE